ncbi:Serine protease easter [Trachymyrmex zeteki]|uniref:Serine protease easter n=1 Tax=Mycetomoellerius zeteki TaxID=64791 RepID=A0A151WR71_9HYME|nr:Serine protease easter [Trachymyrmex zeteki]
MALIAYDTGRPNPEFRCGGTVISSRYVLTAAHCVTFLPGGLRLIGVRVGDHDISKERDCDTDSQGREIVCAERYQDFGVESFQFHPEYTRTKLQNDIALIRLNGTVDFRPWNVKPIYQCTIDGQTRTCINNFQIDLANNSLLPNDLSQRILDGERTSNKTGIFQYPWMALIAYDTGRPNPEFRCGGTVISSRYVLTAAHCVTFLPGGLRLIGVRVGDHDISKERDCDTDSQGREIVCAERYQDFGVESFQFHPEYTRTKLQNDIALIRLNGTVDFRPLNVKPVCLPFGTAIALNHKRAVVTGWGATELGPRSQDLLQAKLPLVAYEQCKEVYSRTTQIWYKQLCAGGQMNVDSCLGDSGGPLQAAGIYNGRSVRIIQYGVVSYGLKQCGTEGFPGVYTNVAYYVDWILNTLTD